MALTDKKGTGIGEVHYCPECGEQAGDGRYCSNCGHAIPLNVAPAPATGQHEVASAPPSAGPRRGAPRLALIAAGALGVVAIAVAAIIIATSGSGTSNAGTSAGGTSADSIYRSKLASALAPLTAANKSLSDALSGIDGSKGSLRSASRAASGAASALTAAKGAIAVLTVPNSATSLSQQVQQALTAENGYVLDVSSTLSNPTGQGPAQLGTLATGAQTALIPLASVAPGIDSSISGADNLGNWANGAAGAAKANGHAEPNNNASGSGGGSASGSSSGGGSSSASSTACGGGVTAGPNTSCPFAQNTYQAWIGAGSPSGAVSLQVYSPVTNQTYTMTCTPTGAGVTCTGANDASVSW